jgi:hypothetical protein
MSWRPRRPRPHVRAANDVAIGRSKPFWLTLRAESVVALPTSVPPALQGPGERRAQDWMPPIGAPPHHSLADRPAIEFGWRAAGEFANKERGICNPREDAANPDFKRRDECATQRASLCPTHALIGPKPGACRAFRSRSSFRGLTLTSWMERSYSPSKARGCGRAPRLYRFSKVTA